MSIRDIVRQVKPVQETHSIDYVDRVQSLLSEAYSFFPKSGLLFEYCGIVSIAKLLYFLNTDLKKVICGLLDRYIFSSLIATNINSPRPILLYIFNLIFLNIINFNF